MKDNFERCLAFVLAQEGGYVNDPRDAGGETNMGISKRSYPREDIKGMTRARAAQIYRRDYWDAVRGDDLPAGLDLVAFDAAVNSGVSRGSKWLQGAVGAVEDGMIGPATLAALRAAHPVAVIEVATGSRLDFLRRLGNWPIYKNGWSRRVNGVRDLATSMASAKPIPVLPEPIAPPPVPSHIQTIAILAAGALLAAAFIFGG